MAITLSNGKIGSTLLPAQTSTPQQVYQPSTYNGSTGQAVQKQVLPASTVANNTAAALSGGGSNNSGSIGNAPQIPQPQQPSIDFNALIQPALDALDSAIAPLQGSYDSQVTGINANKQTATDTASASLKTQTNTIGQAKQTQSQYEKSASDSARRQYAEIQQGLQSRYGGTTGTGAFSTELAGSQALRSLADIKTAAANAQQGLDEKLQQVQEVGRIALQDIQNQAQDQISKAKSNLDLQLADIRNQKGNLLAHKAELAANAMQAYQSTVNQVNAANAQFAQQLYAQQQAAKTSLQTALSQASAISQAATPEDLTKLVQQYQSAGLTPTVTQKLAGGGTISLTPNKSNDTTDILSQLGIQ